MQFIIGLIFVYFLQMPILYQWYKLTAYIAGKAIGTKYEGLVKYTIVLPFILADWWVNMTTMTLVFREWPGAWNEVVTARLKRWRKAYEFQPRGYLTNIELKRLDYAIDMCDRKLDKYDFRGDHC